MYLATSVLPVSGSTSISTICVPNAPPADSRSTLPVEEAGPPVLSKFDARSLNENFSSGSLLA